MKLVISLFLALFIFNAYADNIITDKNRGSVQIKDNAGQIWPASVVYTTDGAGNVSPISGGGGGGGGGTVTQGPKGGTATPWVFDLQYFNGALASATNPIPYRLSDGSTFISPATSALQTSGNATLTSINGKLPSLVAGDLPIALNDGAGNPITSSAAGSQRPLDVQLHNSAGNPFGTASSPLRVDPTGSTVQPVSASSLPLPTGAATEATLSSMNSKLPSISASLPDRTTPAQPVAVKGQNIFRTTFANATTNSVDTSFWSLLQTGSGMTVNQTGGSLVITSGTTANDETIIRSTQSFKGNLELKWSTILSQRIINQTFYVELVDVIGDGLSYTINSSTSVTVTIPSNPFTSANVGQSLVMQRITGTAGTIAGRYAIASVSGNNVTFTVAGFPATGSGTMSLVGWNYVRAYYNGATATNAIIETQRRGYNTNASFTATINTATAPGHVGAVTVEDGQASLLDSLQAAAASLNLTRRGEVVQSLPEETTPMYLQIHVLNGSTAPASTTTWTLGMASVASRVVQNVALNSITPMSQNAQLPVNVLNTPAVTVSSGTVTTVTTLSNGQAAHSAAATGSPLRGAGKVSTALDTTLVANDTADFLMTTGQQLVTKDFATSENDWQFTGALTTNTATAAKAAGAASIRNFVTGFSFQNTSATATTVLILDGATTIAQFNAPASMAMPAVITFPTPLKGTAATALNLNCGTTGANVLVNIQGYQSF